MEKTKYPVTPAVRLLREKRVEFAPHLYDYAEKGGAERAAAELGVEAHTVVKTLVMETDGRRPLLILMHGDREVSAKQLARAIGARQVTPVSAEVAQKATGYMVGGISPFGTRAPLPVYAEKTIFALPKVYINGGKRGFLVEIEPQALRAVLAAKEVEVAIGGDE